VKGKEIRTEKWGMSRKEGVKWQYGGNVSEWKDEALIINEATNPKLEHDD